MRLKFILKISILKAYGQAEKYPSKTVYTNTIQELNIYNISIKEILELEFLMILNLEQGCLSKQEINLSKIDDIKLSTSTKNNSSTKY